MCNSIHLIDKIVPKNTVQNLRTVVKLHRVGKCMPVKAVAGFHRVIRNSVKIFS